MTFKPSDVDGWRFDHNALHFHGDGVFGYGHRCLDQPRFVAIDTYTKRDRSVKRTFMIDGVSFPTLEEALAALSVPPVLSAEDLELLATIPEAWIVPAKRATLVGLAQRGVIEWGRNGEGNVTCRRTHAGSEALKNG